MTDVKERMQGGHFIIETKNSAAEDCAVML
jgi:hypothetical protein